MSRRSASTSTVPAKTRILDAAVRSFSRQSYDAVGLRDIAAEAQVDVAYVHRCFGSKMQLFAEALHVHFDSVAVFENAPDDPVSALIEGIFRHDQADAVHGTKQLDIMTHSLTSLEARDILRDFIAKEVLPLFASKFNLVDPQRTASLLLAYLAGLSLLRNTIEIAPLREDSARWLRTSSRQVMNAILATDVSATIEI